MSDEEKIYKTMKIIKSRFNPKDLTSREAAQLLLDIEHVIENYFVY